MSKHRKNRLSKRQRGSICASLELATENATDPRFDLATERVVRSGPRSKSTWRAAHCVICQLRICARWCGRVDARIAASRAARRTPS